MRFFTSDTHFGHANIIKYCDRPFKDVPHMNVSLVENWNSVVGPDDVVYHLGDVALGKWDDWDNWLSQLNGNKILVVGNHDRLFQENKPERYRRWYAEYAKWFEGIVFDIAIPLADGTEVNMSHFPYDGDSHDADRYDTERLSDEGIVLLHGHTHSNSVLSQSQRGTVQVHVGVDAHHYAPVSEEQVINYIALAEKGVNA